MYVFQGPCKSDEGQATVARPNADQATVERLYLYADKYSHKS